jgi:hypothetical protein
MRLALLAATLLSVAATAATAQEKNFSIALNSHGDPVKNRRAGEALVAACPGLHQHLDGIFGFTGWDTEENGKALPRPLGWDDSVRIIVRTRANFHIPEARNRSFSYLIGGNALGGGFTTRTPLAAKICGMTPARTDDGGFFASTTSVNPLK